MEVSWWGVLPFVAMLLCIAIAPLVPPLAHHWERPRVQLATSLVLGAPVIGWVVASGHPQLALGALEEYVDFICLLGSLFVITGGIHLSGDIVASPRNNTLFLAAGGLLASLVGTTGAAMLIIRPVLNTNRERQHVAHTVVYTIFVVANCGGLLTPLGDPPLFLGLLRGVPFTWTLNLLPHWAFVNGLLLVGYHALDTLMVSREDAVHRLWDQDEQTPLRLHGGWQFACLAGVVASVALLSSPWREMTMLAMAALSYFLGSRRVRHDLNDFTWGPILEVAALFIGIFATMVTALQYLGSIAPRLPLNELTFFGFTGALSSVLDNAPTYATFFELASQLSGEPRVAGVPEHYLVAISLGAVCCGAITYIGNGPNFMVRSVAESQGCAMPSFAGYVLTSLRDLVPTLLAMMLIFLASGWLSHLAGVLLTLAILAVAARRWVTGRRATRALAPAGGPPVRR